MGIEKPVDFLFELRVENAQGYQSNLANLFLMIRKVILPEYFPTHSDAASQDETLSAGLSNPKIDSYDEQLF